MTRFVDQGPPAGFRGYPATSSPRFSTRIVGVDSGAEQVNRRWQHPLRRFNLPEAVRDQTTYEAVLAHWLVMGGPAQTWPLRDPLDFASRALGFANTAPTVTITDQALGTGNGVLTAFQLKKRYQRGAQTYDRDIHLPVAGTVVVGINGAASGIAFTVSRPGGVVTFASAPANGAVLTAGFLFDCEVRFESDDSFDGIVHNYHVSGFADVPLVEVRPC